ncbi:MAG: hypothetical protein V7K40_05865 [Nostoc sp.]
MPNTSTPLSTSAQSLYVTRIAGDRVLYVIKLTEIHVRRKLLYGTRQTGPF